jgi:hypothetical protein
MVSSIRDSQTKPCKHLSPTPCMPHVPSISFSFILSSYQYSVKKQVINFIINQSVYDPSSFLLGANILNTILSRTLSIVSSYIVRDLVLQPYNTTGKINLVYFNF